ncbi:FecCD family ABC transporter permease [Scatolibacter rhodanostii]|uniref:FecCD family ABC transporter permease n=1 Tax=Scatolibacter rhodanostii TaxID=2014781 RepID=UPI000C06FB0F|nr:iron ABC transporter permease [Scatolibacter rhodanostii]
MKEILQKIEKEKKQMEFKKRMVLVICAVLLCVSFIISMNTGYSQLSPSDTLRTLFGGGTEKENLVLFKFRLPRIVISMLVGAGLAVAGCVIQSVSGNQLAEPGLLGINAGAGLAVILFVISSGGSVGTSVFSLPFLALLGAAGAAFVIYMLAYKRGQGIAPLRLILTGVAVQAGISALTTVLVIRLDEKQFDFVANWQAGSIWGSNWNFVLSLLPWMIILLPIVFYKGKVLDVLNLGEDVAKGLGVSVERERGILLMLSVALAASCVSVSGGIGFVGLIAPHLSKRLVGPRHSILLPASAMTGAVLVSAADTLGRIILQPAELPTGIMIAVIGAPYFLYLLAKSR